MTDVKQKMLKVLDDTVDHYSEDVSRRAVVPYNSSNIKTCAYITPNGNRCAVGQFLTKKTATFLETSMQHLDGTGVSEDNVWDIIREEEKIVKLDLPRTFWRDLQSLHDQDTCWGKKGLSRLGKTHLADIKSNIMDGKYENGDFNEILFY